MDIKNLSFFESIDPNVIDGIKTACSQKNFKAGQQIFSKGMTADYLYILEQGSVELLLKEQDQSSFMLSDSGEVFGWSSIVEKGVYTSTATCKTDTIVQRITKQDIESLFDHYPKAAVKFYQRLGSIFSKRISKAIE